MEIKQAHLHISFEDDVMLHNRLLDTMGQAVTNRIGSSYDYSDTLKAIQALARLIETKARKQTDIINIEN